MSSQRAPTIQQMTGRVGPTVTVGSKVYRFGFNDQDAKARLEELIRSHVVREGLRMKRVLGGQDGEDHYTAVVDRLDAGYYGTLSPGWVKTLASETGTLLFVLSLLQEHHPQMTAEDARAVWVAEPEQCQAALRVIAPDFFRAVARQVAAEKGATPGPELDAAVEDLAAEIDRKLATPAPATA